MIKQLRLILTLDDALDEKFLGLSLYWPSKRAVLYLDHNNDNIKIHQSLIYGNKVKMALNLGLERAQLKSC